MSYKIKPEDISDELWSKYDEVHPRYAGNPYNNITLAYIINAAIEAGLVSPPVKTWRWGDGSLATFKPGEPCLYRAQMDMTEAENCGIKFEHWKGQTE